MQIPENGFYYHYKHDPLEGINDHAYEVIGIAQHSEDPDKLVIYRPLYKIINIAPATYFARPLETFFKEVEYKGKIIPRFTRITDLILIDELRLLNTD